MSKTTTTSGLYNKMTQNMDIFYLL